jgi:phenylalanyl-tRNA synthetase alpha chain
MIQRIDQLQAQANQDLTQVKTPEQLEQFRIKYLGAKGSLKNLMALLKDTPHDQKPLFGARANSLRDHIQHAFELRRAELQSHSPDARHEKTTAPTIDVTEPGLRPPLGRPHIITQTMDELIEVFARMGFEVATGPEVEDEYHNFIALNIPPEHPARDPLDNFYLDDSHLLRSQTSTVQIRVMEQCKPPIRIIATGRVYRPDEHDATHYSMFHQIEGLYVDRHVSMADLKTTLIQFAHAYFGHDAEIRLRPSFFPFTEPSAELDIKMRVRDRWDWVELGGCGMVDPNVFNAVGYDPEQWSGFAFGLGVERLAMRKCNITDIRWLFENDTRFLRQF